MSKEEDPKSKDNIKILSGAHHTQLWMAQLKYGKKEKLEGKEKIVEIAKKVKLNYIGDHKSLFGSQLVEDLKSEKYVNMTDMFMRGDFGIKTVLANGPEQAQDLYLFCIAISMYYRGPSFGNLGEPKSTLNGHDTIDWLAGLSEQSNSILIDWAKTAK